MGFMRQQVPAYQNKAAKTKGVATPQKQAPQQAQMANALRSFAGGRAAPTTLTPGQRPTSNIAGMGSQPQVRNQAGTGQAGNIMGMGQAQQPSPIQMPQRPQRPQGMGGKGGRSPRPPQPQIGMQQGQAQQQNKWNAMPAMEKAKYDQSTRQQMGGRMNDMRYRGGTQAPGTSSSIPMQQQQQDRTMAQNTGRYNAGNTWSNRMGQSPFGQGGQQAGSKSGGAKGGGSRPQITPYGGGR